MKNGIKTARRFWRAESGAINILFALLLMPLLGLVGLAIDSSRAYAVKMRLQEAMDSAALVAAKNYSSPDRDNLIQVYFNENWRNGFMDSATPTLSAITADDATRSVTFSARVVMPTIFMRLWGTPSVTVGTLTTSVSALTYLEVALALDNTTSMRQEVSAGVRRVDAMKTAATNFVNTMFTEGGVVKDHIANMWVSIIPFTSMVNVGSQHTNFLVPNSTSNILWDYPRNTTTQNEWRGCLFERSFYNAGGTYPGNDLNETNPAVENFFPYHVAPGAYEAMALCAPVPPEPCSAGEVRCSDGRCRTIGTCPVPAAPPPSPPEPPCIVDGFPCKSGGTMPDKHQFEKTNSNLINVAMACRDGNPPPGVSNYWTGYNISPLSLVYQVASGLKVYYPSPDGISPMAFNKAISSPPYNDVAATASKNASGASICCYGPSMAGGDASSDISAWTSTGRWIAPWPNATSPKLGGWGNSGCGLPLRPLTDDRPTLIAKINEMDIPPLRNPALPANNAANRPDLGYSGTLINQGLIWGWRTISENWRGYWKEPNGAPITNLPLDYSTSGSSKAVVVMTDGLNFLPDPTSTTAYGNGSPLYFGEKSIPLPWSDTNVWFKGTGGACNATGCNGILTWGNTTSEGAGSNHDSADNSAYGQLARSITTTGNSGRGLLHCQRRLMLGMEPHLTVWGCNQYSPMLRNAAGVAVRSATNPGISGPFDLQSALTGPYYNELQSRLLATCSNMRARNVRIFFILFAINDNPQKAAALAAFNTCVGGNGGVYDAANATDLDNAFQAIAIRLRALRLKQ